MPSSELHRRFCANAKALRESLGLTQQQVADAMHRTRAYITQLESGRNCPSLDVVESYADALGVDPSKILKAPKILSRSA